MKFCSQFYIFKDEQLSNHDHFIFLDDLHEVLRKTDKALKKFNLKRSLQRCSGGIQSAGNKEAVSVLSVLQYCFQHLSTSEGCLKITRQIEQELLCSKPETDSVFVASSLELYKLISKATFHDSSTLFTQLQIDEHKIKTLIIEHKIYFSPEQWRKICWFETHFSKSIEDKHLDLDYEEVLHLKYAKFQSALCFRNCSQIWLKVSRQQIKEKVNRYNTAEKLNSVEIIAQNTHIPYVIDNEIKSQIQEYFEKDIQHVICFDVGKSVISNCIQVVIVFSPDQFDGDIEDLCKHTFFTIRRKHAVFTDKIYFINETSLQNFIIDDSVSRFHLRDAIESKTFPGILYEWNGGQECDNIDTTDISENCETCYNVSVAKPLSTENFDLIQEWYLEIPIETQLLFESFINSESLRKSKHPEKLFQQKLEKLYSTYDVFLNVYNRNFVGIFQQANTNELLIDYKAIKSVFNVTSGSGTTTSLCTAEAKLKAKSNDDFCYFNTYLRQHQLLYKTISGATATKVNLRQCHLILMLDNLVRLRYVADPNPGENRSKQICTLPITLQGLPVDSAITQEWHLPDCDGSFLCPCKREVQLNSTEIKTLLLEPRNNEQTVYNEFFRLMTWGNISLWRGLPDDLLVHLESDASNKTSDDSLPEPMCESEIDEQTTDAETDDGLDEFQPLDEESVDISSVLSAIKNFEAPEVEAESSVDLVPSDDEGELVSELEKSVDQLSIVEQEATEDTYEAIQKLLSAFGFKKFIVPPLLCRHPPPATGRDDDMNKIKEILDDVLTKMGYTADCDKRVNRILCGPDNKIGKCLLTLMESDNKYKAFLPEFPLLHVRKSKITILFSAYKDAGLVHLVKFMRDDEQEDWAKLVSAQHIDMATKHVKRIALALHLAFIVSFAKTLGSDDLECFLDDMESGGVMKTSSNWCAKFEDFLRYGSSRNATFELHVDMMRHCDYIVALALAERVGGANGYELMLAAVKQSLLFSFVNNATSYAPYCVRLLLQHYSAGKFHMSLKHSLFSTPFKKSTRNFACDTKREMDHLDALRGFRSGSNTSSVTCRMSLIDSLNETRERREVDACTLIDDDKCGWDINETDKEHIYPITSLILRRNGLSLEENSVPMNVYTKHLVALPNAILDRCSNDVGKYLLLRFLTKEKHFQLTEKDMPSTGEIVGPPELISRAKRSKGVTIRRTLKSKVQPLKSDKQIKEEKRQKTVAKETRIIDCLSSENNTCQALVKPDSSKPKVMKSLGMQRALKGLLSFCVTTTAQDENNLEQYIQLNVDTIPEALYTTMKICTIEFAGIKFKAGNVKTGNEYLQFVEKFLRSISRQASSVSKIVVCEEKYSFTPDDLKANTRLQRQSEGQSGIGHLKTGSSVLGDNCFKKDILTKSEEGKRLVSTYLAQNIQSLSFDQNFQLIIDSELHMKTCDCNEECLCEKYCTPVLCTYDKVLCGNNPELTLLNNVRQRKGEAEMSVVDWLVDLQGELQDGNSAVCMVTSGDIDAVYIHLYAVSRLWPRREDGKFKNSVFVILQKPRSKLDIYNVTAILEILELTFSDKMIGVKVALALCIGGNDFIPKCYQISHATVMKTVIETPFYRENLFSFQGNKIHIRKEYFTDLFRQLYCPKRYLHKQISYSDVRAISIAKTVDQSKKTGYRTSDPRKWLPPESAIERLAELVQLQIKYLETVGIHDAALPNFLESQCLKKSANGEVEFDFGPDSHFEGMTDLPNMITAPTRVKRQLDTTPQHGARRKRLLTSTPKQ